MWTAGGQSEPGQPKGLLSSDSGLWITDTFSAGRPQRRVAQRRGALVAPSMSNVRGKEELLQTIDFDQFAYQESELPDFCRAIFLQWGLLEEFRVPEPVFQQFISSVRAGYHDHPYHNFRHAFDVCQMMHCLLTSNKAGEELSSLDIFVLLIASLVHDIDHNALNNNFHINTQSPLALLYNDSSVLENHHCESDVSVVYKISSL